MRASAFVPLLPCTSSCATLALEQALETGRVEQPCEPGSNGPARVEELAGKRLVVPCGVENETWRQTVDRLGLPMAGLLDLLIADGRAYPRYMAPRQSYDIVIAWKDGAQRVLGLTPSDNSGRHDSSVIPAFELFAAMDSDSNHELPIRNGALFEYLHHPLLDREAQARALSGARVAAQAAVACFERKAEFASECFTYGGSDPARFLANSGEPDPFAGMAERIFATSVAVDLKTRDALARDFADLAIRYSDEFVERWKAWEMGEYAEVRRRREQGEVEANAAAMAPVLAARRAQEQEHHDAVAKRLEGGLRLVKQKRYAAALAVLAAWKLESTGRRVDLDDVGPQPPPDASMAPDDLLRALKSHVERTFSRSWSVRIAPVRPGRAPLEERETAPRPLEPAKVTVRVEAVAVADVGTLEVYDTSYTRTSTSTETVANTAKAKLKTDTLDRLRKEAAPIVERYQELEARIESIDRRLAEPEMQVTLGAERFAGTDTMRPVQDCNRLPGGGYECRTRWMGATKFGPATVTPGRTRGETDELNEQRRDLERELDGPRRTLDAKAAAFEKTQEEEVGTVTHERRTYEEVKVRRVRGEGSAKVKLTRGGKRWKTLAITVPADNPYPDAAPGTDENALIERSNRLAVGSAVADATAERLVDEMLAREGAAVPPTEVAVERDLLETAMGRRSGRIEDLMLDLIPGLGFRVPCLGREPNEPFRCARY